VLDGEATQLPLGEDSADAAVIAGVLCSLPDPVAALRELRRVLGPGGELRFYEHVAARNRRLARLQRGLDATFWPSLFGGCHTSRDTGAALSSAGFAIEELDRFSFRPTVLAIPVAPRVLGRARPIG
jgi:ubiquinone/menaquinone biosynthesis C-methylase UbiE